MTTAIITAQDVHLYYGKKEALKGITMQIKRGEITAMIGPSGCGKSTFLRSLNRMNDLISNVKITGEIDLEGQNIYGSEMDTVQLRKRVGMVFQQPNPFPFSIYENVVSGLRIAGIKQRERL
ncbi:ATP-binding cassette domain-containing protein, partial [Lactobacillus sp. XV13L]|nr:ATP-binding cassette domain-containing protein [Lactobacillus sp. XV13L]